MKCGICGENEATIRVFEARVYQPYTILPSGRTRVEATEHRIEPYGHTGELCNQCLREADLGDINNLLSGEKKESSPT